MKPENLKATLCSLVHNSTLPLAGIAGASFRQGRLVAEAYCGNRYYAADTADDLPLTSDTLFRVASISKLLTAIGVMQLVEQKQLALDRDISDYFGFLIRNPHFPTTPITLRCLLSHTSSLRDGGVSYSLPIPNTIRDFFEGGAFYADGAHWGQANETIGSYFYYANINYGLIGTLIELVSAERFDHYINRHIFQPLGITASFNPRTLPNAAINNIATLYRKRSPAGIWDAAGQWYPQADDYRGQRPDNIVHVENPDVDDRFAIEQRYSYDDYEIGSNATIFSPQGGLRVSVVGLVKIGCLLANGGVLDGVRLLSADSIQAMLTPVWTYNAAQPNGHNYHGLMRQWGLGLQLITDTTAPANGDRLAQSQTLRYAGHCGEAYGLLSGLWFDPLTGTGFAYCLNGISSRLEDNLGSYSSFTRWEEQIMTILHSMLRTTPPN